MMKRDDRFRWIIEYVQQNRFVDVLDAAFVESYVEATGAQWVPSMIGAGWCRTLSRDLTEMYERTILHRRRTGLNNGAWMPGFPKWVYVYEVGPLASSFLRDAKEVA